MTFALLYYDPSINFESKLIIDDVYPNMLYSKSLSLFRFGRHFLFVESSCANKSSIYNKYIDVHNNNSRKNDFGQLLRFSIVYIGGSQLFYFLIFVISPPPSVIFRWINIVPIFLARGVWVELPFEKECCIIIIEGRRASQGNDAQGGVSLIV